MREFYQPPIAYAEPIKVVVPVLEKLMYREEIENFLRYGGAISLVGNVNSISAINHQVASLIWHIKDQVQKRYEHVLPVLYLDEQAFLRLAEGRDHDFLDLEITPESLLKSSKMIFIRSLGTVRFATDNQLKRFKRHLMNTLLGRAENRRCTFLTWSYPPSTVFDPSFLNDLKAVLSVNKVVK